MNFEPLFKSPFFSLTPKTITKVPVFEGQKEEKWINVDRQTLMLVHEEDMWCVYAGLNLDGAFNTYGEAAEYLNEEGFTRL